MAGDAPQLKDEFSSRALFGFCRYCFIQSLVIRISLKGRAGPGLEYWARAGSTESLFYRGLMCGAATRLTGEHSTAATFSFSALPPSSIPSPPKLPNPLRAAELTSQSQFIQQSTLDRGRQDLCRTWPPTWHGVHAL